MLKDIHDPTNPNKCCLRGPRFIQDKQLKEWINQYNLKCSEDKGSKELSAEEKERQEAKLLRSCILPTAKLDNL